MKMILSKSVSPKILLLGLIVIISASVLWLYIQPENSNPTSSRDTHSYTEPDELTDSKLGESAASQQSTQNEKSNRAPSYSSQTPSSESKISDEDLSAMEKAQQKIAEQQERVRLAQCAAIESKLVADITTENSRHQSALSAIESDYNSRGLGFSGLKQEAINQENSIYQANLSLLQSNYNATIASQGC